MLAPALVGRTEGMARGKVAVEPEKSVTLTEENPSPPAVGAERETEAVRSEPGVASERVMVRWKAEGRAPPTRKPASEGEDHAEEEEEEEAAALAASSSRRARKMPACASVEGEASGSAAKRLSWCFCQGTASSKRVSRRKKIESRIESPNLRR